MRRQPRVRIDVTAQEDMMRLSRRTFLRLATGAAALPFVPPAANAQTFPSRPVTLVHGNELGYPGGNPAFALCKSLAQHFGQKFNLQETQSDSDTAAAERVVKARPDGHTLLLVSENNAIIAGLKENPGFDLRRDLVPVAGILRVPLVMMVSPSFPARTVPELIAYAKANPRKMNYASANKDPILDLAAELFNVATGIKMVRVPFASNIELRNGLVPVKFTYLPLAQNFVQNGWARILAVTTTTRTPVLPDVPAVAEHVAGYEASSWQGIAAPRDTPAGIVATLNKAVNGALADPRTWVSIAESGAPAYVALSGMLSQMTLSGTPDAFGKLIAEELEKWGRLIRLVGIKQGRDRLDIP
ncbi:MAG: MFS transporter [Proteobacteria bacterium]|nr:MAG: MFS transporter [Pseudomonadota bacterium]